MFLPRDLLGYNRCNNLKDEKGVLENLHWGIKYTWPYEYG
jgi:hypothetical protein